MYGLHAAEVLSFFARNSDTRAHLTALSNAGSCSSTRVTLARISRSFEPAWMMRLMTSDENEAVARAARISIVDWERVVAIVREYKVKREPPRFPTGRPYRAGPDASPASGLYLHRDKPSLTQSRRSPLLKNAQEGKTSWQMICDGFWSSASSEPARASAAAPVAIKPRGQMDSTSISLPSKKQASSVQLTLIIVELCRKLSPLRASGLVSSAHKSAHAHFNLQ